MVSDIEPIFAASPALRGVLSADVEEGERNTLLSRRFPGGSLKIVAAKAPRNLRRHTARVLIDRRGRRLEIGAEGNPITLAERRTLSFANRKIIIGSTPLFEDTSHVLRAYARSDQRVFEVPCPECGGFTEILWAHIEWTDGAARDGRLPLPALQGADRGAAQGGAWSPPAAGARHGPRCRATRASGSTRLCRASRMRHGASSRPNSCRRRTIPRLQTFVNTILAKAGARPEARISRRELAARGEPFGLDAFPPEVLVLTAGIDVQDDRLEITIIGWTRDGTAWCSAIS